MQKLREIGSGSNVISSSSRMTTRSSPDGLKLSKSQKRRKAKKNSSSISTLSNKAGPGVLITTSDSTKVPTLVFNNPDSRKKSRGSRQSKDADDGESPGIDVDLKKARYEIMKFGINGLTGAEKVDAETGLAISLGAVPDKRPCVNYKELLEKRKEEREMRRLEKTTSAKPKVKTSANKKSKTAKMAKKELTGNNIVVKSKLTPGQKKATGFAKKNNFSGKRPDKRTRMNMKK